MKFVKKINNIEILSLSGIIYKIIENDEIISKKSNFNYKIHIIFHFNKK